MLNLSPVKDWGFHSICTEIQNNYLTDCHAPFIISCSCRQLLPGHFPSPCLPKTTTLFRAGWVETSRHRTLCCRSDGDASLHFPCFLWLCVIGKASTSTVSISPKPTPAFHSPSSQTLQLWWSRPHGWSISPAVAIRCDCQNHAAAALQPPAGGGSKVLVWAGNQTDR